MTSEFDENELEFGGAAVAMMEQGYTPRRLNWLVTCAIRIPANVRRGEPAQCSARCRRRSALR
jgi:hypothetical protein